MDLDSSDSEESEFQGFSQKVQDDEMDVESNGDTRTASGSKASENSWITDLEWAWAEGGHLDADIATGHSGDMSEELLEVQRKEDLFDIGTMSCAFCVSLVHVPFPYFLHVSHSFSYISLQLLEAAESIQGQIQISHSSEKFVQPLNPGQVLMCLACMLLP
ncbi:hypothetical protein BDR05DRAFT_953713 [Suillus weaverae]|nr:hypothetical protein BDR05DRAFT_953713 [Suillus weaverae]